MANCDMCGRNAELFLAKIEGTELSVCKNCAGYGNVIKRIQPIIKVEKRVKVAVKVADITETIVEEYAQRIRTAREKLKLSHQDFAKKINEKESLLHNLETGKQEPSIKTARKIERILKIRLIEESNGNHNTTE